jgi:hypothetical protein
VFTSNVTNVYNPPQDPLSGPYLVSRQDFFALMRRKIAFRTIPLGDIELLNEIRLNGSGVVDRWTGKATVRRMYSARIEGRESRRMTVAIYQGQGAEEVSSCGSFVALIL